MVIMIMIKMMMIKINKKRVSSPLLCVQWWSVMIWGSVHHHYYPTTSWDPNPNFFLPNKLSQNIWKSISYKSACHAWNACRLLHLRLFRNPVRMHLCVALEVWYSSFMLQFQGHCTFCVSWHWQGWRKEDHYSRPVECVLCVQKGGWGTIVITVDNHCHCTKMHQKCFLLRCTALVLW